LAATACSLPATDFSRLGADFYKDVVSGSNDGFAGVYVDTEYGPTLKPVLAR
jgi:hypothetical protein